MGNTPENTKGFYHLPIPTPRPPTTKLGNGWHLLEGGTICKWQEPEDTPSQPVKLSPDEEKILKAITTLTDATPKRICNHLNDIYSYAYTPKTLDSRIARMRKKLENIGGKITQEKNSAPWKLEIKP